MLVKTVKVSEKGQIAIPIEMREETGIVQGDDLLLIQEGKKILIEPSKNTARHVKEDFSDLLKISEKSVMKVWNNKSDEIWDEYIKQ